jgi:hypothetical protein
VSVISAPQDEWRQTLKARRRISIVPKRFIHGTGRKWVRTRAHTRTHHLAHTARARVADSILLRSSFFFVLLRSFFFGGEETAVAA